MIYLLYNPLANNSRGKSSADELIDKLGECEVRDLTAIGDDGVREIVTSIKDGDEIYLVGGDGTLQRFANVVYGMKLPPVYFCAAGTGNDFLNDRGDEVVDGKILVNPYIVDLPTVTVNGETRYFVNGIGFGIDGMCCEIADDIKTKSDKPINYTSIAIKQCLGGFKRRDAIVTVDGVTNEYKNIWICPSMNGKCYGGGMFVAPNQDRLNDKGTVTLVAASCRSRLRMLLTFPKIFTGAHVTAPIVHMFEGKEIHVKFSKPCALQIDGETVRNVTEYSVKGRG